MCMRISPITNNKTNFTNASIDYTIPEGTWYLYLENGNPVEGEKKISVPAHEFRLYTNFAE